MQRLLWTTMIAGVLGLAGVANAGSFADADKDGDGAVTQIEFAKAYPEADEEIWTQIDANADGEISEDEHEAAMDSGLLSSE